MPKAKGLPTREEQFVGDDIGEGTHDVGAQLYLAEGGFYIFDVNDDVHRRAVE